jgi:hypothetical protein
MPKLDNNHAVVRSICPSAHPEHTGQNAGIVPLILNISSDGVVRFMVWLINPARTEQLLSYAAYRKVIVLYYPITPCNNTTLIQQNVFFPSFSDMLYLQQ